MSIHPKDREKILQRIANRLDDGQYAYGKYVGTFEREFAEFVGTKYAVMTNSATTAIEMAVRFWSKEAKRPVIQIPTNTYMATFNAIENVINHSHIFLEGCSRDLMMNPDRLSFNPNGDTLLLYVGIGGNISSSFGLILDFVRDHNVAIIVDEAHSLGCSYRNRKSGDFGVAGCFSLFPTKIVHCGGEGGVLTTNDRELYEYAMSYRHHGRDDYCIESRDKREYAHIQEGSNYKPYGEIAAIIAQANLKRLPEYIKHRKKIIDLYREKVDVLGGKGSNWYKAITYQVKGFKTPNISFSGSVFETPLHIQPRLKSYYYNGTYSETEKWCKTHKCLPLYNDMTFEEAEYVLKNITEIK